MITQRKLKAVIAYDQATGKFSWLARPRIRAGKVAGCMRPDGYIDICVSTEHYLAHRLAFLWVTGEFPAQQVDHINGIRSDNRWENLREADYSLNQQNLRKAKTTSTTGYLGVSKNGKRFQAVLKVNGVRYRFGTHDTPELAHAAYVKGKRTLHPAGTL